MSVNEPAKSKATSILRVLSIAVGLIFVAFGVMALREKLGNYPIVYDSTFKFGIAALGFGIVFLFIGIRKRTIGKDT